jgi:hypothetical protein
MDQGKEFVNQLSAWLHKLFKKNLLASFVKLLFDSWAGFWEWDPDEWMDEWMDGRGSA